MTNNQKHFVWGSIYAFLAGVLVSLMAFVAFVK